MEALGGEGRRKGERARGAAVVVVPSPRRTAGAGPTAIPGQGTGEAGCALFLLAAKGDPKVHPEPGHFRGRKDGGGARRGAVPAQGAAVVRPPAHATWDGREGCEELPGAPK